MILVLSAFLNDEVFRKIGINTLYDVTSYGSLTKITVRVYGLRTNKVLLTGSLDTLNCPCFYGPR
jgi:hypothetical protein